LFADDELMDIIGDLINARYADPGSFSEFAEKMKQKVTRLFQSLS
jgi:hypothetical protein